MVHREEHNENFTIVDNAVLQNVNLSFEARGFFVYLLSLPDDWNFSIAGLVKQTGASESVVRRLMTELQVEGYIILNRHINERGRVTRWTWDIYETAKRSESVQKSKSPQVETTTSGKSQMWCAPVVEEPERGSTTCGKSDTIQSTNNNKVLNKQSTKDNKVHRFTPPTFDEVDAYCKERNNGINPQHFIDYYSSQNWKKANGRPVADWKACVRTWEQKDKTAPTNSQKAQPSAEIDWEEVARLAGGDA